MSTTNQSCDTGFGNEFAKRLDKIGVTVFAGCLFPEGPGALELKELCSKNLQVIHLDVTKDELIKSAVKDVATSLQEKQLWAIVNNAGIGKFAEIEFCSLKNFKEIMDVNVIGVMRLTQAFLPFIRHAHGRIVFVGSTSGRLTANGFTAYAMSKHAIVALADGLRREMMKFKVSVYCVEPWFYRTPICLHDVFVKNFNTSWEEASEDLRRDYGGDFYNDSQIFIKKMQDMMIPSSRLHEVTDDMLDAVVGSDPKIYYGTGRGLIGKLLCLLPGKMVDHILYYVAPRRVPILVENNVSK